MTEQTPEEKQRSELQNNALHLYFEKVAEMLNDSGNDMRAVLPPTVLIEWNKKTIKEKIWRPIQRAQVMKESTTELNTKEIDIIFDTVQREILTPRGIHVPFPSIAELIFLMEAEKEKNGIQKRKSNK